MAPGLQQLTQHVYWLPPEAATDRPLLGVVAGARRTLVVDAGNSPAHALLLRYEMAQADLGPGDYLALTHWHWDHIFGSAALGLTTFSHVETKRKIDEMAAWDWSDAALDRRVEAGVEIPFCRDMIRLELPERRAVSLRAPDITFSDQMEIDLGGVCARLIHVGGDHGADASVVFAVEDRVVFLGDCLSQAIYAEQPHYTTANLFPLLDRLLALEAEIYLEGHNPQPLERAELEELAAYMKAVGKLVEERGPARAAVLRGLKRIPTPPDADDPVELADLFIAGLSSS